MKFFSIWEKTSKKKVRNYMINVRISQRKTREEKQNVTLRLRIYIDNITKSFG